MQTKIQTKIVKDILNYTKFTIEQWQELFRRYKEGESVSISTISWWRQGKQSMGKRYRKIFICILCEQQELKCYEEYIRQHVMRILGLAIYCDSYWLLKNMTYREFLYYVLEKLKVDDMGNNKYNWDNIPVSDLLKLCVDKAKRMNQKIDIEMRDETLRLEYVHDDLEKYNVYIDFCLNTKGEAYLENKCGRLKKSSKDALLLYMVVTQNVSDELYVQTLEKHGVYLVKIDFYDINQVHVLNNYITYGYLQQDEKTLYFMNALADVVLHKIFKLNHMVLKEIFCRKYDFEKVNEHFFESNAGLWMYRYPMRRALAFEEKIIRRMLHTAAKKGKCDFKILDINLSGGLLGLRCSSIAGSVTCVDVSCGCIQAKQNIIERYNKSKDEKNSGLTNIEFGYLRVDNMKIIGVDMPKDGYDMIVLGLGGGSYVEDIDDFLKQASGWLKNGKQGGNEEGVLMLSVFNSDALCYTSPHVSLDFRYDLGTFRHVGDEWTLHAKLYTNKEICHLTTKYYELLANYSYPTVLSVIGENYQGKILEKLKEIDKSCASVDMDVSCSGLLHTLCLKKIYPEMETQCYLDTYKYLREQGILVEIIQHEEITSKAKMVRELNRQGILAGDNFVKTVVLKDDRYNMVIYYLLPLNKNFKKEYLKNFYSIRNKEMIRCKLRFCTEAELKKMGLTTGSVSPFSFSVIKKNEEHCLICDLEICNSIFETLYTYSGDLNITYKIGKSSLISYLRKNNAIFV